MGTSVETFFLCRMLSPGARHDFGDKEKDALLDKGFTRAGGEAMDVRLRRRGRGWGGASGLCAS